jgi:hypothetical protein
MTDGYGKPLPVPDEGSRPFFDGAAAGRLMLQRCVPCGQWMWPVAPRCIACMSGDIEWAPSAGLGTLYSFSLVHQVYHPGFAEEVPYNVAFVDLDEGVRVTTNVVGVAHQDLRVGLRLQAVFEPIAEGIFLPRFRSVA